LRTENGLVLLPLTAMTELKENTIQLTEIFLDPGGCNRLKPTTHEGVERLAVLEGTLLVELGHALYHLEKGDSITVNASLPHRISNPGKEKAHGVWMIVTPRAT